MFPRTEYPAPSVVDGSTLGMTDVKSEKWGKKDEADYAVILSLEFRRELNNGTLCICVCSVRSYGSSGSAFQLLMQFPSAGSRV